MHIDVQRSQKYPICVHPNRVKPPVHKVVKVLKYYDMSVLYSPGKANVVTDDLSCMSMGSASYVEDEKKV